MGKQWKLIIGIHRGTYTSRDVENPKYFDSLSDCRDEFKNAEEHYLSLGCQIWFATAKGPGDEFVQLSKGSSYRVDI